MIYLNGVEITGNTFPNNELNLLSIEEAINARSQYKTNHFILKYEDDRDLMALFFAKKQVDLRTSDISNLSMYYCPYSRMDRAETIQTPFMLKFFCDFINQMSFSKVEVFEPHSDVTGQLLNNFVKKDIVLELLPTVMESIGFNPDKDFIVYPDETATKRYGFIGVDNKLFAKKKRDFATGHITDLEIVGETNGEPFNALIVDDLCSRGGTFLYNAEKLKERGANNIFLLIGHCENTIFDGKIFNSGLIEKVFTTDSILTKHHDWNNLKHRDKLKVYGMELFSDENQS